MAHLPSVAEMKAGIAAMLDLPVSLLGLAMFRSWLSLLTHEELLEGLDGFAHDLALAAALLALAFLAGRISPLSARRWPMPLAALIACVVSGLALWANASGVCAAWAGPALGTLAACASAIFILGWCELYCLLDLNRIAMALALSFVLAVGINLALENSTAIFRHATLVMLPVASLLCYLRARHVVSTMSESTTRRANPAVQRFPWPLLGLIALYYLASGICMGASDLPSLVFKNSANALAGLLLLVPVVLFSKSFDLRRLLSSPLAIFVCVLLLLPFAGFGGRSAAVAATTAIGAALFELAVFLLMCDIAQRRHCAPIFLFGIEEAAAIFQSGGIYLGERHVWLESLGVSTSLLVVVLVALAGMATLAYFREGNLEESWGVGALGPGKIDAAHERRERTRTACARLSEEKGLTARETEVLSLLADGASIDDVCGTLSIARGTAKAHCEHIYSKAGVRSKAQLLELLEEMG